MNSKILSIHGGSPGHDCSIACVDKNDDIRIFEYERFVKIRHCSFSSISNTEIKINFLNYIKEQLKEEPKYVLYTDISAEDVSLLQNYFKFAKFILMGHHTSHCIGAYHQSGFKNALVISLDAGGMEYDHYGISKTSKGEGVGYSILKINDHKVEVILATNFPKAMIFTPGNYAAFVYFVSEIDKNKLYQKFLNDTSGKVRECTSLYAGKLMGLSAYGKVREEWVDVIKKFYEIYPGDIWNSSTIDFLFSQFSECLDINSIENILSGQDSYDLAATNQHVFEELCWNLIKPYLDDCNFDVVFSGGCALNVIFTQKVAEYLNKTNRKLFVSPTPGDEGLSYGHYCSVDKTMNNKFSVYCGFDILDREKILDYYNRYSKIGKVVDMNVSKIVDLIKDGKIGATMIGYSEVGPRALGNRSIICDPSIPEMKDTLNAKVKFREWFRPFGPVCREEDKDIYFDNAFVSPHMTFAPMVKEEYRDKLPAITHVDGTARLQTVTRDQHELFYDILTELDNRGHDAVILNTSFNIKGKPILTTVEDAFYVLENTELDFLILEDYLFLK